MKRFKYLTLAALVGLWACDSGTSTPTEQVVTGTISGTVTIGGTGASGVTVTLSSGTTATTGADGTYTFSSVNAGAYTVTISGFAADATFDATTKAATITTAGQVQTVNFSGSYIKTSSIVGVVAAGGTVLPGVNVSIGSASTTTGTAGQYSFSGLRAGSYTVTISGFNAAAYTFGSTSQTVTVGVGESKVASFTGSNVTTASVTGRLFLDENNKDDIFTPGLEDNLKVANVAITLEGNGVSQIPQQTMMTGADGTFAFTSLAAGNYRVTVDATSSALPGNVAFGGTSTSTVVAVSPGSSASVNFPFDITVQTVKAFGFLGTDAVKPGITPIAGWTMNLYDTEANAVVGGATGKLNSATVKTDATGTAAFRFLRTADKSPNAGVSDQIVFAQVPAGTPGANYTVNGETVIEIKYNPKDSVVTAPDTFDALYNNLVLRAHSAEIDNDTLAGWTYEMRADKDSVGGGSSTWTDFTDANGDIFFNVDLATIASIHGAASLPDTLWFKLAAFQGGANGHAFSQTPSATEGTAVGSYLRYIWNGTTAATDTIDLGTSMVKYKDVDVTFQVHHEADDSTDVPTYTAGDNEIDVELTNVQLYSISSSGTKTSVAGPTAAAVGTGIVTFLNVDATKNYEVRARSTNSVLDVLNDTVITPVIDGSDQTVTDKTLKGGAGNSSFAVKYNNGAVSGTVQSRMGASRAKGLVVTIAPTSDNIQGTASMKDTTDAVGAYSFAGLREGPYMVTVAAGDSAWTFLRTLTSGGTVPPSGGAVDNLSATSGMRDLAGYAAADGVNFEAYRTDTKISGLVLNDRDQDNTVDISDALSGAIMQLYMDDDAGSIKRDTLVATDTTDASGAYSFTGLREGRYMVKWVAGTPDTNQDVLRALNTDSVVVTPVAGTNVGTTSPATLPKWDYSATAQLGVTADPAHFLFLAKNTVAKGTVKTAGGTGIAGMVVSIRRCNVSTGSAKPPVAVDGTHFCTSFLGTTVNATSDASGNFEFDNLIEGVYQVMPNPGTVGGYTTSAPAAALYLQQNPADIETMAFVIS